MSVVYMRLRYSVNHLRVIAAVLLVVLIGGAFGVSDKTTISSPEVGGYLMRAVCAEVCASVDSLTLSVTVAANDDSSFRISAPVADLNIKPAVAVSF
ncbi:hypothetical protein [Parathalassolituus penaei]|uniref:Uncharacterized protein n=1 Tax=Parathalassolituus penaei TaxID=2997323 RepID=A0A9X3EBM2_9GAMM|nr:hypothetical protein [Parathalassolituus penaei]MCY0964574.1 hypothetical protein [Parathalassolituus penaei]